MIYSVKTLKWVQNGFTLAYYNNKPLFVHGALPEEVVDVEIVKENSQHAFGIAQNIHQPNPIRKTIDCSIFPLCGGCNFRHLDYQEEIKIKVELLKEFKELKYYLENHPFDYFFSPEYAYRNQVRIHYDKNKVGFYKLYSNQIIPLPKEGCKNLSKELNQAILNNSKNLQKDRKIFYVDGKIKESQEFVVKLNSSVEWELSTECFLQTNRFLLREWLSFIRENVLNIVQKNRINILELFCGTGIISASLMDHLSYIEGYESNKVALKYAKKNYNKYYKKNKFIFKDLYTNQLVLENRFDIVIINPPRKGMGKNLLNAFKNIEMPILYSSCNPATFHRDIQRLKEYDYKIHHIAIFDFFPRTFHLEIVASLIK